MGKIYWRISFLNYKRSFEKHSLQNHTLDTNSNEIPIHILHPARPFDRNFVKSIIGVAKHTQKRL